MTDNRTTPMTAAQVRAFLHRTAIHGRTDRENEDNGVYRWGACTSGQSSLVASWLGNILGRKKADRAARLAVLDYCFGDGRRVFDSSSELRYSEAQAVLKWLESAPPDVLWQECQRCLVAARREAGQVELPLMGAQETKTT